MESPDYGVPLVFLLLNVFLFCHLPIHASNGCKWDLSLYSSLLKQRVECRGETKSEVFPNSGWAFWCGWVCSIWGAPSIRIKDGVVEEVGGRAVPILTSGSRQRAETGLTFLKYIFCLYVTFWRNMGATPWDVRGTSSGCRKWESQTLLILRNSSFLKTSHIFRKAEEAVLSFLHLTLVSDKFWGHCSPGLLIYLAYWLWNGLLGVMSCFVGSSVFTAWRLGIYPLLLILTSPRLHILPDSFSFPIACFCFPNAGLWTQNTFLEFITKYFFACYYRFGQVKNMD